MSQFSQLHTLPFVVRENIEIGAGNLENQVVEKVVFKKDSVYKECIPPAYEETYVII